VTNTLPSPTVLLLAPEGQESHYAPAIALLEQAGVVWQLGKVAEAAGAAVVLCLMPAGSTLAAEAAAVTQAPVLSIPWSEALPASTALLVQATGSDPALGIATLAIGEAGVKNAALAAISLLAGSDPRLASWWADYRAEQTAAVLAASHLP